MMKTPHHASHGFTLVEMAFLVLILGLFIGSTIAFLNVEDDQQKYKLTVERQKRIALALNDYVEKRGFLPCPGDPGAAVLGEVRAAGCATFALSDGIVPFRELGLSQSTATDGYGQPFTYAMSSVLRNGAAVANVEAKCRLASWVPAATNRNSPKARICCQSVPDNNAIIVRPSAGAATAVTTIQGAGGTAGAYAAPDTQAPSTMVTTMPYFAYALISHGKNGFGAYIFGDAAIRRARTTAGADERENVLLDADLRTYVSRPPDPNQATLFDDIVLWRTQEQMMAEAGSSCSVP